MAITAIDSELGLQFYSDRAMGPQALGRPSDIEYKYREKHSFDQAEKKFRRPQPLGLSLFCRLTFPWMKASFSKKLLPSVLFDDLIVSYY
jgi:hypothetical protein